MAIHIQIRLDKVITYFNWLIFTRRSSKGLKLEESAANRVGHWVRQECVLENAPARLSNKKKTWTVTVSLENNNLDLSSLFPSTLACSDHMLHNSVPLSSWPFLRHFCPAHSSFVDRLHGTIDKSTVSRITLPGMPWLAILCTGDRYIYPFFINTREEGDCNWVCYYCYNSAKRLSIVKIAKPRNFVHFLPKTDWIKALCHGHTSAYFAHYYPLRGNKNSIPKVPINVLLI